MKEWEIGFIDFFFLCITIRLSALLLACVHRGVSYIMGVPVSDKGSIKPFIARIHHLVFSTALSKEQFPV